MPAEDPKATRETAVDKPEPKPAPAQPASKPAEGETLSYSGRVTDKDTGKPIAGATVTVRRSELYDPKTGENRIIEESRHQTDADGKYAFTIPPEQAAVRRLYIELDVEHPNYAPKKGFGYSLEHDPQGRESGGRPFFETYASARQGDSGRIEAPGGSRRPVLRSWPFRDRTSDGYVLRTARSPT